MLNKVIDLLNSSKNRKDRFEQVMSFANMIAAQNPTGLLPLLRLVASTLQSYFITSSIYRQLHSAPDNPELESLFFSYDYPLNEKKQTLWDLPLSLKDVRYSLKLGRDPLLAVPWHRNRLSSTLCNIGTSRDSGPWSYDPLNHYVQLLLPFGLGLVHGGNHSITAGIVNAEGTLLTESVTDLSPLYEFVKYDGIAFIRRADGYQLSTPHHEEPGILFEIGRLMVEHGITYDVEPIHLP